jgi:hypothetical protein
MLIGSGIRVWNPHALAFEPRGFGGQVQGMSAPFCDGREKRIERGRTPRWRLHEELAWFG